MNASKTEFTLFGSRQQLNKGTANKILVCGDSFKLQNCFRYLGVFLGDTLDFKEHIKRKCQTAMLSYFKIKCIRKYLTKEDTEVFCLSLVISHLDYCNVIPYIISQTELAK